MLIRTLYDEFPSHIKTKNAYYQPQINYVSAFVSQKVSGQVGAWLTMYKISLSFSLITMYNFIAVCHNMWAYIGSPLWGCEVPRLGIRVASHSLQKCCYPAVEVVPGIYAIHWKFSMCTATRTSSYSPVGSSVFFIHI